MTATTTTTTTTATTTLPPHCGLQVSSIGDRFNKRRTIKEDAADLKIKETTELVLADLVQDSVFFSSETQQPRRAPVYQAPEVKLGPELGTGEFGVVFSISDFCLVTEGKCHSCKDQIDASFHKKLSSIQADSEVEPSSKGNNNKCANKQQQPRQTVSFAESSKDSQTDVTTATFSSSGQRYTSFITDDDGDDGSLTDDEDTRVGDNDHRWRIATFCCRNGTARYAIKRLKNSMLVDDHDTRTEAMLDLACEARYLEGLVVHPNVVRLRATIGMPGTESFGIIMDRLVSTLDVKLSEWKAEHRAARGGALGFVRRDAKALETLYLERLWVCLYLARAMQYIHSNHLLYRDIKPENIGFNVRGVVQVFDFGLVRELKKKHLVQAPDGYDATGLTGTRRYMSPEVVRCLPYGYSADVFSYSILFWEIASLKKAFSKYDSRQHFDHVVTKGKRPARLPSSVLSRSLHEMMTNGWSEDPLKRPSFQQICKLLEAEMVQIQGGKLGGASGAERSARVS